MTEYESWGRYPRQPQRAVSLHDRHAELPQRQESLLPYGNGRSYGDSCLNTGGWLLHTRGLDRFIAFDPAGGVLRCEAGVLLSRILELVVPQGWFLPVTPGTRFVTVGGAIANDVHGKNHHRSGSFGHHVTCFELLRSDGRRMLCSPTDNPEWFAATVGGLGLTGLITWAELRLRPIAGPWIIGETICFRDLDGFFALSRDSDQDYEYTVAWVDCASRGRALGRGLFMRGNHAPPWPERRPSAPRRRLTVPFSFPLSPFNAWTLRAFNGLYYHRHLRARVRTITHYEPFFYPLDALHHWNRLYGRRGFLQYQCVIPPDRARESIAELLARIASSGTGSFLAVLKMFGAYESPGLLSFPRPGVTLALDFPYRGRATLDLMERLDQVVNQSGGALYPAKDARMSGEGFRRYFPNWENFTDFIDPGFSSSFWCRVMNR